MSINQLLHQYAVESGELPADVAAGEEVTVADVIAEHAPLQGEATLPDEVQHAEKAAAIADQLDDLADRAEELAGEDKQYLDQVASTESLHREYVAVMRANQINLPAESFESAHTDKGRLEGIAKDARKAARVSRSFADKTLDFSSEGKITQFLRRDEAKLAHAGAALRSALQQLTSEAAKVKAEPVAIKHSGIARFMTQDGKAVKNLPEGVHHDVQWLDKAVQWINQTQQALIAAAKADGAGIDSHLSLHHPADLATQGGLMGAHSLLIGAKSVGGFDIPTFTYKSEHEFKVGSAVKAYFISGLKAAGWAILGGMAIGAVVPATAVGALAAAHGAMHVANNVNTVDNLFKHYDKDVNKSDLVSAAGYNDLVKAIQDVLGLAGHLKLKLDDDAFNAAIGQAGSKKAALKAAYAALAHLADIVYEHAFYLTISMGTVAEKVAKAAK